MLDDDLADAIKQFNDDVANDKTFRVTTMVRLKDLVLSIRSQRGLERLHIETIEMLKNFPIEKIEEELGSWAAKEIKEQLDRLSSEKNSAD